MNITKSLKQKIIEANTETLESSSVHAIPNITRNKFYSVKLVWIICFMASSGVCAWFIYNSISSYLNYDVVTNIELDYVNKLQFPVISICFNGKTNIKYLNESVISCSFNIKSCELENDFELYKDPLYNCFRFNSGRNMIGESVKKKYAYGKGDLNSLILQLYAGNSDINDINGFFIYITDENADSLTENSLLISSGASSKISINKYKIVRQPQPYSNCISDLTSLNSYESECYKKTYIIYRKYQFSKCANLCLQKFFGDMCNFQLVLFGPIYYTEKRNITELKANSNETICFLNYLIMFKSSSQYLDDCDCPLECESSGYTYTLSNGNFPGNMNGAEILKYLFSKGTLPSNYSLNNFKREISQIQIHFEEMRETVIKQEIKTQLADLISGLGGTLGLFLG